MMQSMIDFTVSLLGAVADWFGSEPIIYLFGIICACFVIKILKSLMTL